MPNIDLSISIPPQQPGVCVDHYGTLPVLAYRHKTTGGTAWHQIHAGNLAPFDQVNVPVLGANPQVRVPILVKAADVAAIQSGRVVLVKHVELDAIEARQSAVSPHPE